MRDGVPRRARAQVRIPPRVPAPKALGPAVCRRAGDLCCFSLFSRAISSRVYNRFRVPFVWICSIMRRQAADSRAVFFEAIQEWGTEKMLGRGGNEG